MNSLVLNALQLNGGKGSGNFGHGGRPGMVGGSGNGKGGTSKDSGSKASPKKSAGSSSKGGNYSRSQAKKEVLDVIKKGGDYDYDEDPSRAIKDGAMRLSFQLASGEHYALTKEFLKTDAGKAYKSLESIPGNGDAAKGFAKISLAATTDTHGKSEKQLKAKQEKAQKALEEWAKSSEKPADAKVAKEFFSTLIDAYYEA